MCICVGCGVWFGKFERLCFWIVFNLSVDARVEAISASPPRGNHGWRFTARLQVILLTVANFGQLWLVTIRTFWVVLDMCSQFCKSFAFFFLSSPSFDHVVLDGASMSFQNFFLEQVMGVLNFHPWWWNFEILLKTFDFVGITTDLRYSKQLISDNLFVETAFFNKDFSSNILLPSVTNFGQSGLVILRIFFGWFFDMGSQVCELFAFSLFSVWLCSFGWCTHELPDFCEKVMGVLNFHPWWKLFFF